MGLEVGHQALEVADTADGVGAALEGGERVTAVGEEVSVPTRTVSVSPIGVPFSVIEPGTTRDPCGCVASQV